MAPDRLQALINQSQVTGIDFVFVHKNQVDLDIYFHQHINGNSNPVVNDLAVSQIHIASPEAKEGLTEIPLSITGWSTLDGRAIMHLQAEVPGDFTPYSLSILDSRVDRYFNHISFSFKANCESDLDCKPQPHDCPPDEWVDFPINYQARDFWSFRRALLDFASERYPNWTDRLEADAGIMLAEMMSALGDEMAYYQDRIAREAYLETATQRRSIRKHARLIDYEIHDGLSATCWMDIQLAAGAFDQQIPAGMLVYARLDTGETINFEVGEGLQDTVENRLFWADERRNTFAPHIWDEDDICLPVGTREMFVKGHVAALFDGSLATSGEVIQWVLLKTNPEDPAIPARDHLVEIIEIEEKTDFVFAEAITRLRWRADQALPVELNMSFMEVHANILPATSGQYHETYFVIGAEPTALAIPEAEQNRLTRAVERQGHDQSLSYLYSLTGSDEQNLAFVGSDVRASRPEIRLTEITYNAVSSQWDEVLAWDWKPSFIGINSSQSHDNDFVLEDGTWRRVKGFQRIGQEIVHKDYATQLGKTIRFGDGEFGMTPAEHSVFRLQYRLGAGQSSNVAAGSLVNFDENTFPFIQSITNPIAAHNGQDPESPHEIRQQVSDAFREITYRAVRPEDYAEAAERLPWVQRAGTNFRWTGSWLTAFTTPDPRGSVQLEAAQRAALQAQLNRFRQAGREAHVMHPIYANIDLEITVCVSSDAYTGEAKEMTLEALFGKKGNRPTSGFFSPDRFSFGTPLDRSQLEAAIQQVPGVKAVEEMWIERKGWFRKKRFKSLNYDPGQQSIIRIENDPLHPERGSVKLIMKGGA